MEYQCACRKIADSAFGYFGCFGTTQIYDWPGLWKYDWFNPILTRAKRDGNAKAGPR